MHDLIDRGALFQSLVESFWNVQRARVDDPPLKKTDFFNLFQEPVEQEVGIFTGVKVSSS